MKSKGTKEMVMQGTNLQKAQQKEAKNLQKK
jgi:hypothetical protein